MTQFNTPAYEIERPTSQCALTGRALNPGEIYIATLVEVDPPEPAPPSSGKTAAPGNSGSVAASSSAAGLGLKRVDVALEAWDKGQRPERLFSYWRSTVPQPNQKKKLFVDDDVLVNLFRRLADTDQPERLAFRFVLGLILMRKKLLRYDGMAQRPAGGTQQEWWQLIPKGEQQPLDLLNPQLDDDKIRQVTGQLSEILQAEL